MIARPKIYLIDTDPVMRSSIDEVAVAMNMNAEFHDRAETFLQTPLSERAGCVVSEFRLMGMNGISLQEKLVRGGCLMPILFVTKYPETALTVKAIKAGAVTVLEKPFSRQDLWDSLQTAIAVEEKTQRIDAQHRQLRCKLSTLTSKEREVLDLIVAGKPNKVVANQLAVSVRTIESRRHQIFKKTGAGSVAELVKLIVESGDLPHQSE
jgi:two-component system, LuxR family, response regulator FixJ